MFLGRKKPFKVEYDEVQKKCDAIFGPKLQELESIKKSGKKVTKNDLDRILGKEPEATIAQLEALKLRTPEAIGPGVTKADAKKIHEETIPTLIHQLQRLQAFKLEIISAELEKKASGKLEKKEKKFTGQTQELEKVQRELSNGSSSTATNSRAGTDPDAAAVKALIEEVQQQITDEVVQKLPKVDPRTGWKKF
jgi:hypothetical protein